MRIQTWSFPIRILCLITTTVAALLPSGTGAEAVSHQEEQPSTQATLTGFAQLPAETFLQESDPSGTALGTASKNGITPPFADQPIQGFSGVVRNSDGTFTVVSDNGYGKKANSADFLLRVNHIYPDVRTEKITALGGFYLSDPHHYVPFPLTRSDRILTGSDFDPESIVRDEDGTYWIGDEFGPFLLHVDQHGQLLSSPVSMPNVNAPENPLRGNTPANLGRSRGVEGLVILPQRRKAYALLEGTVDGDTQGDLRLNEFNLMSQNYTGERWIYRLDSAKHAIGDIATIDGHKFLVLERDAAQGIEATVKKVYLADTRDHNNDGVIDKTLVADLLNLANPDHIGGFPDPFRFPFSTIESIAILDCQTLAILNDNNFPFSAGRTPGKPDNNEFITIRLAKQVHRK